ncbi:16S rRNA (cytidine(1402)-2'-O)-methyltransferase [Holospora curviuscula]|uniref:16S rRNA (cytidine(1402)-2'-O)-methyltransferase n=1 Tax=Holospora curviuscula TaxID=1082868 RepID=UPI0013FD486F|nr:16S rRNA (cytidine(1402)-2'-O)-methyltransferase [Holospora curviuscula]
MNLKKEFSVNVNTLCEHSSWAAQIKSVPCGLFVVPTPIGHREDISLRALVTLNTVDVIVCEDTRITRPLLQYYGIQSQYISYHQHNEKSKLNAVLTLARQQRIALVSDRGTPGVSDAGILLISSCYQENIPVHIIPGPCSVIQSFLASGFIENNFLFYGFLPRTIGAQRSIFESLHPIPMALIFFESPYRLKKTLMLMGTIFHHRQACVLRELTKRFEEIQRGTFSTLTEIFEKRPPKGECIIVVAKPSPKKTTG